ncbi:Alpha-glucoside transport system permease protein AglG [[Actinomadura] parvosata subsp. kistnae]|uniref:Sugar ABC transporter permease n=2 Tax=Nonomuraea TaxID=83681 RepID=A0A1V0A7S1_9ACTN|nr:MULTISPECIES: carbohydrate ABC transporter permease [unclassified Nonomuraea]AQZ66258.1 sugar ABC transporter permease [Nonomuraea sp. ATCC 55076]NJP92072.1 carbohydrate ABC transporter permease [Nonomuraea sp. FMUSA5-5]SPL97780.1 Alpha-glucoside transport system permease protein AglG [Actinomadura parvosata subsp. kistnae]
MTTATAAAPSAKPSGLESGAPRRGLVSRIVDRIGSGAVQVIMILLGLFWLVPTLGLLVVSLRTNQVNSAEGWWTIFTKPAELTIQNYANLLGSGFTASFWNTVLITVPTTVLVIGIAAMAAYAFAWMDFPGRDTAFLVVVGLLIVPIQIALIPIASFYGATGIFGSIPGVVLFHVAFGLPFAIFLLRNFFVGIPASLLEAARMDGAPEWKIFVSVVFPLGKPAIASLGIFQFLWVWNDMLIALVFADTGNQPMTKYLQSQMRQFGSNTDILSSGAFMSLIIPLILFFAFQRYFVQGMMAGSVK